MRPEILFPLFAEATTLPGIGKKTAPLFEKVGIARVVDALFTPPSGLIDRRLRETVQGVEEGTSLCVEITVGRHSPPSRRGAPYRITVSDGTLDLTLVFFRMQGAYLNEALPQGERRWICGKLEHYDGMAQIVHPDLIADPAKDEKPDGFEPVYPATQGLSARVIAKAVAGAAAQAPDLPEWNDAALMVREKWEGWQASLTRLHAPTAQDDLSFLTPQRRRLAYDELLSHQLALALIRSKRRRSKGRETIGDKRLQDRVLGSLGFTPTGAQNRAIGEIAEDMATPRKMLRLLQGDVGAGKTLVALMAMLIAVEAGGQAAMMAPTEILARQHFASLVPLAEAAGVRLALLTGRDKAATKRDTIEALALGNLDLIVGTHALFQAGVDFADLRLAIIDEQHRFGVDQRNALAEKGRGVDILAMSATPIPRTLAMASYGDMDISVLDEKPPGRKPIDTRTVPLTRYEEVVESLQRAIAGGARAYWICPLVEESEVLDATAAEDRAASLRMVLGAETVALAHGQLESEEKDAAMARFKAGEAKVLVATTVVEVGVDVPEATIIVIEHAERFGLAQLHQLRGRVGRGTGKSSCVLLYKAPLTEGARARLGVLRETEDGFRISEEDLKLRGAGDLLGVRQAGMPKLRLADLEVHRDLLEIARDDARLIVDRDPELKTERGEALRILLYLMGRDDSVRYLTAA